MALNTVQEIWGSSWTKEIRTYCSLHEKALGHPQSCISIWVILTLPPFQARLKEHPINQRHYFKQDEAPTCGIGSNVHIHTHDVILIRMHSPYCSVLPIQHAQGVQWSADNPFWVTSPTPIFRPDPAWAQVTLSIKSRGLSVRSTHNLHHLASAAGSFKLIHHILTLWQNSLPRQGCCPRTLGHRRWSPTPTNPHRTMGLAVELNGPRDCY